MVNLVNGRGQLGEALKLEISKHGGALHDALDCWIYHTWNHVDKDAGTQAVELSTFKEFVNAHSGERIVFISAIHEKFNSYGVAKMEAELYLWKQCPRGLVIRIPYMLGKGLAARLKAGGFYHGGDVEVVPIDEIAMRIFWSIGWERERLLVLHGKLVDIGLLRAAILFGKE